MYFCKKHHWVFDKDCMNLQIILGSIDILRILSSRPFSKGNIQVANMYLKRCSTSLIIRVTQIKTTIRYHLTPVRMASIKKTRGLPWWHSGWESACQCRGHGFKPWFWKIPHAVEWLGLWATITEPARLEPVLRNKRGRDNERPAHCDEEWPPLPQLKKALAQKRRLNTTKNKK